MRPEPAIRTGVTAALLLSLVTSAHASTQPRVPSASAPSEAYTTLDPILLPESLRLDSTVGPGELVFAFTVDTAGRVEPGSVQTLLAADSSSAQAARRALPALRYTPARLLPVGGVCVRVDGAARHCGKAGAPVRPLRKRVLLRLEVEPRAGG